MFQGYDKATMELTFFKYQGAGNDFVMVDNRTGIFSGTEHELFGKLCHRRFGIGADGLILLQNKDGFDFEMKYYNADGNESTMCGNGGRCVVMFAKQLGLVTTHTRFIAIDGPHEANLLPDGNVSLQMGDVQSVGRDGEDYVLNTGSPHYVQAVPKVADVAVFSQGRAIRQSDTYAKEGINVNFLELTAPGQLKVRTYERGVEDETYACGTGVTASAIVAAAIANTGTGNQSFQIETLGGMLGVSFDWDGTHATNVWLTGPAELVFEGSVEL